MAGAILGSFAAKSFHIGSPAPGEGRDAHAIAVRTGVLDVNSAYAYVLLFDRFRDTCLLASTFEGRAMGFVTGFRCPRDPAALFLWQIGVDPAYHGRGVGRTLLEAFVRTEGARGATRLETTVAPDNAASLALFRGFADRLGVPFEPKGRYEASWFPSAHAPEDLYAIALPEDR